MSTDPGLWFTIMILLLALSAVGAGLLGYRIGYHEGAHDGRVSERQRWMERSTRHATRTLQTRLRDFPPPVIRAKTGPLPRVQYGAPRRPGHESLERYAPPRATVTIPVVSSSGTAARSSGPAGEPSTAKTGEMAAAG